MPAAIVPAAFENIGEADEIGIHIGVRIDQRMAHAGLRREMHHERKAMLREQGRHAGAIGEIELDKAKAVELGQLRQPRVFQLRIVISVQIVEPDNLAAIAPTAAGRHDSR